jgi:hypothetical protein
MTKVPTKAVTVFAEDHLAPGGVRSYGPESLLRRCIADDFGLEDHYQLKTWVKVHPVKANNQVVKRMRECKATGSPHPAVFLLDGDRLKELFEEHKLVAPACSSGRKSVLRQHVGDPAAILVFLGGNLEHLIGALRRATSGVGEFTALPWDRALGKNLGARDKVFNAVANSSNREVRATVRANFPSMDYLVKQVESLLAGE